MKGGEGDERGFNISLVSPMDRAPVGQDDISPVIHFYDQPRRLKGVLKIGPEFTVSHREKERTPRVLEHLGAILEWLDRNSQLAIEKKGELPGFCNIWGNFRMVSGGVMWNRLLLMLQNADIKGSWCEKHAEIPYLVKSCTTKEVLP